MAINQVVEVSPLECAVCYFEDQPALPDFTGRMKAAGYTPDYIAEMGAKSGDPRSVAQALRVAEQGVTSTGEIVDVARYGNLMLTALNKHIESRAAQLATMHGPLRGHLAITARYALGQLISMADSLEASLQQSE